MDSKYNTTEGKATPNKFIQEIKSTTYVNFHSSPKRPKLEQEFKVVQHGQGSLLQQRKSLPAYGVRNRLISEIQKHPTLIIIGETGSGKTTQIPQFIHDIRLDRDGMIGITQPRRVAAITLSQRVAQEMNTELGKTVGYAVRFEDVTSIHTKLKYLTDGMLLREAVFDILLLSYCIIVLDEAHERTVHTDVLFGIVKQAQSLRKEKNLKPLKIIIMSATMDVDHFGEYFGSVPILYLEGRQYPIQVYHTLKPQEDYVFSCLVTIFQIHQEAPANQDILVFLTGQEEIEAMAQSIRLIAKDLENKCPALKVYPLYSSLPSHQQLDVFRPTPQGMRKVILSTNIAETSVTISGIKFVIDSGMVKVKTHHPGTGLDLLKVQKISQAQAWQRTGRAGRESAGFCYRVYTHQEYNAMLKNSIPEIQRCNLANVVLQLLALGIDTLSFDFLDMPPKESVNYALHQLKQLGAIDSVDCPKVTKLGHEMAYFPVDPRFSKIILSAKDYECLEEILNIVAIISSESIFVTPPKKRDLALAAHQKFTSSDGDHITLLNVYKNFMIASSKKQWCHENFLNFRNLQYASEVRTQLLDICKRYNISPSSCGQNVEQVIKCLVTGLFMNVAELQRDRQYVTLESRQIVSIHPSSVLFGSRPQCILFTEVVQTGRCYLRQVSQINPEWLSEMMPEYVRQHRFLKCIN